MPLVGAIRAHVFAAARIHADDTTAGVPSRAKPGLGWGAGAGRGEDQDRPPLARLLTRAAALTDRRLCRRWACVRDDRPFAGPAPPAAAFFYSPDRSGEHPERHLASFAGIMQADAYAGFDRLYEPGRQPGPILEAACRAHARRKLYDLAALAKAPIATEAVRRIDQLFAIKRGIAGRSAEARPAARAARSAAILAELEPW